MGMSIKEVSRVTGIPDGTLYNFEYKRRMLSVEKLKLYADALGLQLQMRLAPKE
jgi:transcriptional regulator with XRE-family HTH domain